MRALADRLGGRLPVGPEGSEQRSVLVIGAGITGLVAAYELRRRGVTVKLFEASRQAGGCLRSSRSDGFLVEHGARSAALTPALLKLVYRLGLSNELIEEAAVGNRRFVARNGRLHRLPESVRTLLTTSLVGTAAKLRLLAEPFVLTDMESLDESVESFVTRRCGREIYDHVIEPTVSFEAAGDAASLSMARVFPRAARMEQDHGSIGKGLLFAQQVARGYRRLSRLTEAEIPVEPVTPPRVSFRAGMYTLALALEEALTGALQRNTPARLSHRVDSRWMVDTGPDGASTPHTVDVVILATPAHVLASMELPAEARRYAAEIERVHHPAASTLTLGFRRADIAHPLDAGTVLLPVCERHALHGISIDSTQFAGRAPAEHVTLTCHYSDARCSSNTLREPDVLAEIAMHALRSLLGARGEPVFRKHVYWPRGYPQYTTGYHDVARAADATELMNPGLYLAGNYRNGSSVSDCVESGLQVAERVAAYLARAG